MEWLLNNIDILALIFSLFGLGMSFYALFLHKKRTKIMEKQYQDKIDESKKGKITLFFQEEVGRNNLLILKNEGEGNVTNIRLKFKKNNKISEPNYTPIPQKLAAGNKVNIKLKKFNPPPWDITLKWDDDYKKDRTLETTLS
ncbi:hypothetical protein QA612_14000 [Evansella sp. AB-P1]|uniref:hypothetical protein n=1 Tax=Evansella sp. AB-P1 TaxID=3037653 RepID=UPI00241CCF70|nr:hypothetical protein [Evansella sp. AB-P1]MDG5788594.1 hypothetical protein [Evansella sp. AB-P1]